MFLFFQLKTVIMSFALRRNNDDEEKLQYREKQIALKDTGFGDRVVREETYSYIPNSADDEVKKPKYKYRGRK